MGNHQPKRSAAPRIVGIAGPSAGAKTTLARMLVEALRPRSCLHISHDDYYRNLSHLSLEERQAQNFDCPEALETELLVEHLQELRSGRRIEKPVYDFARHTRGEETELVGPAEIILVEGILVLAIDALREQLDLSVYVDTPPDICLARRILRDTRERGRSVESVIEQYLASVQPMHERHVYPSRRLADIVVADGELEAGVERIAGTLRTR